MGILLITPESQAAVDRVRDFADRSENWYQPTAAELQDPDLPSGNKKRPGNDPEHRYEVVVGTYHCTYSMTVTPQGVAKHLSVKSRTGIPNPIMVCEIARMFGFHEDERQWQMSPDACKIPCMVVIQPTQIFDENLRTQWNELLRSRGVEPPSA